MVALGVNRLLAVAPRGHGGIHGGGVEAASPLSVRVSAYLWQV